MMKNPDCVYEAFDDAAKEWAAQVTGVDEEEREALVESKREKISEICSKWFEYSEYLTVEVDTEAKTCVVVPART